LKIIDRNNWSGYEVLPFVNYTINQKKKLLQGLNERDFNVWVAGILGYV